MSIGDVLNELHDEFPDITISKIRFLESQGLVEPERTPSGYRKFYAQDVERLRFVLRQQREHFLPLKVIKDRLDEADRAGNLAEVVASDASAGAPTDCDWKKERDGRPLSRAVCRLAGTIGIFARASSQPFKASRRRLPSGISENPLP